MRMPLGDSPALPCSPGLPPRHQDFMQRRDKIDASVHLEVRLEAKEKAKVKHKKAGLRNI